MSPWRGSCVNAMSVMAFSSARVMIFILAFRQSQARLDVDNEGRQYGVDPELVADLVDMKPHGIGSDAAELAGDVVECQSGMTSGEKAGDAAGKTLVDTTSEGPWLMAKLPAGNYKIAATFAGNAEKRTIAVGAEKMKTVDFRWASDERREVISAQ